MPPQTTLKHLLRDRAGAAYRTLLGVTVVTVFGAELSDVRPVEVLYGGGLRGTKGAAGSSLARGDHLQAAGEARGRRLDLVHRA